MPTLSLVVLAWDQLHHTERCVESLRATTDVDYELIVVDNGSAPAAATRAEELADVAVLNPANVGFAAGMNAGLAAASGDVVAFVNNDTVFPPEWASRLVATLTSDPAAGIVVPAVSAAGNAVTVRAGPGDGIVTFAPFTELPSGVVYLMRTDVARSLGGWNEDYRVATGEDLDLLFTVWTNDLGVILDERVLVHHESKGTLKAKVDRHWELQAENLGRFLDRWTSPNPQVPRLDACPEAVHIRNLVAARAAAVWMRRYFDARRRAEKAERAAPAPARRKPSLLDRLFRR